LRSAALRAGLRRKEENLLDPLPSAYPSARERASVTHWANLSTRLTALIIEKHSGIFNRKILSKKIHCIKMNREQSPFWRGGSKIRCASRELPDAAW
jgi:hypothetical protein